MSTDVLSDVLSAVRLTGSVFFDVTAATPWVAEAPPAAAVSRDVVPRAQRAIEYHVVAKGSCWASIVDRGNFEPVKLVTRHPLECGDLYGVRVHSPYRNELLEPRRSSAVGFVL